MTKKYHFCSRNNVLLNIAGGLLVLSTLLSGCGVLPAFELKQENPMQTAISQELPVGEAVVMRDTKVPYSVPAGVSVLMYHMVGDEEGNAAVITEENFDKQMRYLKGHGYHPITMQELYDYVTKGSTLPEKPVCITFDDGYADNYTIVYPLMKKYGFPWTLYLITGEVGKPNQMTWEQLKEMAESHTVTIANHTVTHPKLGQLPSRLDKEKEIRGAQEALAKELGVHTTWISYPYGDYDQETMDICKELGIKLAVIMSDGRVHVNDNPLELHRVWVGNEVTLEHLEDRLHHDDYIKI